MDEHAIAAGFLGAIQRLVGGADQIFRIVSVRGIGGDSRGDRDGPQRLTSMMKGKVPDRLADVLDAFLGALDADFRKNQ